MSKTCPRDPVEVSRAAQVLVPEVFVGRLPTLGISRSFTDRILVISQSEDKVLRRHPVCAVVVKASTHAARFG